MRKINVLLASAIALFSFLPASVQGINGSALEAAAHSSSFSLTLPWGEGLEHTILEGYGASGYALDLDLLPNEMVFPAAEGNVVFAGIAPALWDMGNVVFIDHGNGTQSLYAGLRSVSVANGQHVGTSTQLGLAGGVGNWKPLRFTLYTGASFNPNFGTSGGQAVPSAFSSCVKTYKKPCENLAVGDLLSNVTLKDMTTAGLAVVGWTTPGGTTQYHIQIVPLNDDGPGIDLIVGDLGMVQSGLFYVFAPVFGSGNYVLLPGAYYSWKIRFSSATHSIGVDDPSWGPWSGQKWFRTKLPDSLTLRLVSPGAGAVTSDTTPTLQWTDGEKTNFYYEIQLSADSQFRTGGDATAAVYWNLVHGGLTNPLDSWTVPDGFDLAPGTYYFRVRQRVQATPLGIAEQGVPWTSAQSFAVAP